jgi:hypothetical protein
LQEAEAEGDAAIQSVLPLWSVMAVLDCVTALAMTSLVQWIFDKAD